MPAPFRVVWIHVVRLIWVKINYKYVVFKIFLVGSHRGSQFAAIMFQIFCSFSIVRCSNWLTAAEPFLISSRDCWTLFKTTFLTSSNELSLYDAWPSSSWLTSLSRLMRSMNRVAANLHWHLISDTMLVGAKMLFVIVVIDAGIVVMMLLLFLLNGQFIFENFHTILLAACTVLRLGVCIRRNLQYDVVEIMSLVF